MALDDINLSDFIRQERTKLGLSLRELAAKAKLDHSTIGKIESGSREQPRPVILQKIARALGVDYESLAMLAGYLQPGQLPETEVFLRAKEDLTEEEAAAIKAHVDFIKSQRRREGNSHGR